MHTFSLTTLTTQTLRELEQLRSDKKALIDAVVVQAAYAKSGQQKEKKIMGATSRDEDV